MMNTHEVVSAFLDNEPFDPDVLEQALADPAGRKMLLDLIALRHVVREDPTLVPKTPAARTSRLRLVIAAAAVIVALFGGYRLGERHGAGAANEPPTPTRVVPATGQWR
jgi:hypothetical protein